MATIYEEDTQNDEEQRYFANDSLASEIRRNYKDCLVSLKELEKEKHEGVESLSKNDNSCRININRYRNIENVQRGWST